MIKPMASVTVNGRTESRMKRLKSKENAYELIII